MDSEAQDCLFCSMGDHRIAAENDLAFAIRDDYPVTEFHTLIIPRRHVVDYFGLTEEELMSIHSLIHSQRQDLLSFDPSIDGFNIGNNNGKVAGQSIFHCHIHLIPRRHSDVETPKGGIRHVIPGKGAY